MKALAILITLFAFSAQANVIASINAKLKSYNETHVTLIEVTSKKELRLPMASITLKDGDEWAKLLDKAKTYTVVMSPTVVSLLTEAFGSVEKAPIKQTVKP